MSGPGRFQLGGTAEISRLLTEDRASAHASYRLTHRTLPLSRQTAAFSVHGGGRKKKTVSDRKRNYHMVKRHLQQPPGPADYQSASRLSNKHSYGLTVPGFIPQESPAVVEQSHPSGGGGGHQIPLQQEPDDVHVCLSAMLLLVVGPAVRPSEGLQRLRWSQRGLLCY